MGVLRAAQAPHRTFFNKESTSAIKSAKKVHRINRWERCFASREMGAFSLETFMHAPVPFERMEKNEGFEKD
jgi:hypothetical protein